mmetsp:Transcript_993/g.1721  ORF Transcript_993/g.1721 Transcript_993/m.1721 type:complete len:120 (+) Transcript_993:126-485(+)
MNESMPENNDKDAESTQLTRTHRSLVGDEKDKELEKSSKDRSSTDDDDDSSSSNGGNNTHTCSSDTAERRSVDAKPETDSTHTAAHQQHSSTSTTRSRRYKQTKLSRYVFRSGKEEKKM